MPRSDYIPLADVPPGEAFSPLPDPLVLKGRISTRTIAGAALSVRSDYGRGEAIELRYSSALSNTQFQGIALFVDTSVANTSTIRGLEVSARRSAAVAVGTIEGANIAGYARVDGTGDVTNLYGVTGEAQMDDGYTGTITELAAVRAKVQIEDGATVTAGYGVLVHVEGVTGGAAITALFGAKGTGGGTADSIVDSSGVETTNYQTATRVVLMKFLGANGTTYYLVHDTDTATVTSVETAPE